MLGFQSAELSRPAPDWTRRVGSLTPDVAQSLVRDQVLLSRLLRLLSGFLNSLVKRPCHPSSSLSTLPCRLYLKDTAHVRRQIHFCANFVASKARFFHEENKPRPLGPSRPGKEQGCPGLSLSHPLHSPPPPRFQLNRDVTATFFCQDTRFSPPTLFFRSLPSCGEERAKAKRKHPGRISRSGLP